MMPFCGARSRAIAWRETTFIPSPSSQTVKLPQHHAHNQQLFARAAELIPGSISGVP
jgi:hypothetical protein